MTIEAEKDTSPIEHAAVSERPELEASEKNPLVLVPPITFTPGLKRRRNTR
jgi:hypothetical protein